jgi:hypothetical protein
MELKHAALMLDTDLNKSGQYHKLAQLNLRVQE